jgi:hypothetical protein
MPSYKLNFVTENQGRFAINTKGDLPAQTDNEQKPAEEYVEHIFRPVDSD